MLNGRKLAFHLLLVLTVICKLTRPLTVERTYCLEFIFRPRYMQVPVKIEDSGGGGGGKLKAACI